MPDISDTMPTAGSLATSDTIVPDGEPTDAETAISGLPLSKRYDVTTVIASGGMGEVLLAHDIPLGRDVAIKRMLGAKPSPESVTRFLREARIQGRLQHPAIVPVHDLAIDASGRPFFAMKVLPGETLASVLLPNRVGPTRSRAELLRAFIDICLAIELAHTSGVLHRDLKPSNIALGDFGEVYVLDWGVARIMGDDHVDTLDRVARKEVSPDSQLAKETTPTPTLPGSILGTPGYMAPEQLRGERTVGPAADIYSLGCILFEILAGEPLHSRSGAMASTALGADARVSMRGPGRTVSPELDAICVRATATEPDARFPTARALAGEVQRYLDGDRDIARRRELARAELIEARGALERGSDQDRRDAMRAAGRALSLDPESTEAAELVSHLMLAAPDKIPDELHAELVEKRFADERSHARLASAGLAAYILFLPLLLWIGIRDWSYIGLCYAVLAVTMLFSIQTGRLARPPEYRAWITILLAGSLIVLFGHIFGPFIIPAGIATISMAVSANNPYLSRRGPLVILVFVVAAVGPWALELIGVVARTYRVTPTVWELNSNVLQPDPGIAGQVAIALYMMGVVTVIGILSLRVVRNNRDIRDRLELQAWHLRQLVPSARPSGSIAPP